MAVMNVLDAGGGIQSIEKPMSVENNALLTSIDGNLTTIDGRVDGLETLIGTTNSTLTIIDGRVDGLEALITSTNSKLDTLNTAVASTADTPVESHQPADVITFTPVIDTAVYAPGEVLFVTTLLSGITRVNDGRANLLSLTAIDKAKQNAAITLLFYQTNVTSAAINTANAMSDADQLSFMGSVDIAAADWKTWANNSTLCYSGAKAPNLLLESVSGGTGVYIVGIVGTAPTYGAAGDLVFKLGVVQA
jgi:hypothetical protein